MDSANKIIEELDQIRKKLASVSNLLLPIKEQSIRLTDAWNLAKACHDEIRAIVNRNNDDEQSIEVIVIKFLESTKDDLKKGSDA